MKARAELVVPRSMPMFIAPHALAHVELQLPAPAVFRNAPELQHAGFGDYRFESDADNLAAASARRKVDLDRSELFQFVP